MQRSKPATGARRMAQLGRKQVQLWFIKDEYERLKLEAKECRRSITEYIRQAVREKMKTYRLGDNGNV